MREVGEGGGVERESDHLCHLCRFTPVFILLGYTMGERRESERERGRDIRERKGERGE